MMLLDNVRTLVGHRELLLIWTLREIKVRYKQSALGAAWAILQPIALMLVFNFVFSVLVRVPTDGVPYPLFSFTALLAWTFFATSLTFAIPSLVNNLNLVTKVYFPREILPIASVGAALFDFLISSVLLLAALVWYQVPVTAALLWLPVIVGLQLLLTFGVVLPFAAVNVFYRDVRFVLPLLVQVWMYASPIIYPVSLVPEWLRPVYGLNPMVGIIDSLRRVLLLGEGPDPLYMGLSGSISLALALLGYIYFKRSEGVFADCI